MATSLIPIKQKKRLVTYYVDSGVIYTAKVKKGKDAISDLEFTPSLSGWTFLGWREDTEASGTVLSEKAVGKSDVTLYAVFKQTVTLSYSGNGASSGSVTSQTKTRYYNNGNYSNPTFTLAANGYTRTGYEFTAWAAGSTSGTQYAANSSVTLSESTTYYAVWNAVTVTIYDGNTLDSSFGTLSTTIAWCYAGYKSTVSSGEATIAALSNISAFKTVTITYKIELNVYYGSGTFYINDTQIYYKSGIGVSEAFSDTYTLTTSNASSVTIKFKADLENSSGDYTATSSITLTKIAAHV